MNENAKSPWTSARCNRLLRPLSSKLALLRKATLSEPRHDECHSGFAPSSSSHNLTAAPRVDTEWEISPRPWKKIKRTYSSRSKGQSLGEAVDYNKDGPLTEARDVVIRLPLHLMPGKTVGTDEDLTARDGQYYKPAQTAPPRAPRGSSKNAQIFHGSQALCSAISTGLSNRRLSEGICKALEALLRATHCEKTYGNGRCRTLFSTCLRQIPDYIAEEQCLANDENPENDIDVASEVYTDLEAFGSAPDGGWESLREVVRAHGIRLVGKAIEEGLIELPLSHHILSLCLGLAAYDEAGSVIESMIALAKSRPLRLKESTTFCAGLSHSFTKWATSHQTPAALPTDEASEAARSLNYYVSRTGRYGFMYRQTAVMLEDGILPVDWISSKAMVECWNGVIRSITQQDEHAQSAALLLQTAISKSCMRGAPNAKLSSQIHHLRLRACGPTIVRPTLRSHKSGQAKEKIVEIQPFVSEEATAQPDDIENALQSTFSSILTVLSAINFLRSSNFGPDTSHPNLLSVAILRDVAVKIRQVLELATSACYASRSWSLPAKFLRLPLLSAGLVSVASRKAGTEISPDEVLDLAILASLPSTKVSLSNAGSFVCEVVRCCDEGGSGDGFRLLQIIVQDLIAIATSNVCDKPTGDFCSGIAHAAAFAFSEHTGQAKHLDWALDLEGTITRTVDDTPKFLVDRTPARTVMRNQSGYKWEDGICEWIAKTPALALERPTATEDVHHDSTYGDAPKLTLVQALSPTSGDSPCATDRRLPRPKRRGQRQGASCDSREIGKVQEGCGMSSSLEKLLFIRVSPRPRKVPGSHMLSKVDTASDLDELSAPASSHERPIALREIPNLASGMKREMSVRNPNDRGIGCYKLDMPVRKRHRADPQTFSQYMDDELGYP